MAEVALRRAAEADLPFLSALASGAAVEPFLMPGAGETDRLATLLELGRDGDGPEGLFVIETGDGRPAGGLVLRVVNERSRICTLSGLMIAPEMRRTGIAAAALGLACRRMLGEHGLHRRDQWLDGVLYGILAEELRDG